MKEPLPFQPLWTAFRGGVKSEGKGLLPGDKDTVEKFVVHCGTHQITVEPKKGDVWVGSRRIAAGFPGGLVWKRRMQFQMATHDKNDNGMASCLFYSVGLDRGGMTDGCKLFEDGKVLEGIH